MNKKEIQTRIKQIQELRKKYIIQTAPKLNSTIKQNNYITGINVIIPTYKGESVILKCLNSLFEQTISKELYEVIVIINGEKDATERLVYEFIEKKNMTNVKVIYSDIASASEARNLGIKSANREYTIFLDDDDYLSNNFLEKMYKYAEEEAIVISQIYNVDSEGNVDGHNAINNQIISCERNKVNDYKTLNMVTTINACKLVPTKSLKEIKYDSNLRSGEDVVFFIDLLVKNNFKFKVIPIAEEAIYFRVLRDNSVSRQSMTYDFNVIQRLDVISKLNDILEETTDSQKNIFIKQKINSQTLFINRYLKEKVNDRVKVIEEIKQRNVSYFPYNLVNKGLAKKLVISYCFPPYVDTSGNVMAKRIREKNEVVDVVYNKMDKVRSIDNELNLLVSDLIDERFEVPSYPSFSNWKAIEDFCKKGLEMLSTNKNYEEIYSRAMWPGSHFLAFEYKIKNPKVRWVAEFSDPLLLDIHAKKREAKIDNQLFIKNANKQIKRYFNHPNVQDSNLFFWCEYLPYVFADELVFTNENQLKYMLDYFPLKGLRKVIKKKAVISPQPTLSKEYYLNKKSNYEIDSNKVNFAYFGTFYQTRNLEDVFLGLENVNEHIRKKINLHIFTAEPEVLKKQLKGSNIEELINVNKYVNYLEFLNLSTIFDCLIVNDAQTKQCKDINPYLPSKLSDYLGSGNEVWGIYEPDSILSKYDLSYKSELGDINQATKIYEEAVNRKNEMIVM